MKKTITSILLLLSFSFGYCQLNTFKLASYSQPEFYRKVSFTDPAASFNTYRDNSNQSGNSENSFYIPFYISIQKYNNKYQSSLTLNATSSISLYSSLNQKRDRYFASQSLSWDQRIFLTPNDLFVSFDISQILSSGYRVTKVKRSSGLELDSKNFDFNTRNNAVVNVGKGRIEDLSVGWHAVRLLETICDHSDLDQKTITPEQVTALADKLGQLRNIRNTDSRLEFNREVEELFEYLKSKNLINGEDYYLFSTILDTYRFENFASRRKGSDISFGIGYVFNYKEEHENDLNNEPVDIDGYEKLDLEKLLGPLASLSYNYYYPLNNNWQINFQNSASLSKIDIKDYFNNTSNTSPAKNILTEYLQGDLNNSIQLFYILSPRTNLYFTYRSLVNYEKDLLADFDAVSILHRNTFSTYLQYYFSPWNTLNVDFVLTKLKGYKNYEENNIQTEITVSTNYYFH